MNTSSVFSALAISLLLSTSNSFCSILVRIWWITKPSQRVGIRLLRFHYCGWHMLTLASSTWINYPFWIQALRVHFSFGVEIFALEWAFENLENLGWEKVVWSCDAASVVKNVLDSQSYRGWNTCHSLMLKSIFWTLNWNFRDWTGWRIALLHIFFNSVSFFYFYLRQLPEFSFVRLSRFLRWGVAHVWGLFVILCNIIYQKNKY